MRRVASEEEDDLRPEYDFSQMKGGVRGKYVERYREGTNLVLLDPDIASAFPDAKAVNDALRSLLQEKHSPQPVESHRSPIRRTEGHCAFFNLFVEIDVVANAYLEVETCTSGSRRASCNILPTVRFPGERFFFTRELVPI